MFEGSKLQPGDTQMCCDLHTLGTSHMPVSGDKGKPDERTYQRPRTPHRGIGRPFIVKGHVTNACVAP